MTTRGGSCNAASSEPRRGRSLPNFNSIPHPSSQRWRVEKIREIVAELWRKSLDPRAGRSYPAGQTHTPGLARGRCASQRRLGKRRQVRDPSRSVLQGGEGNHGSSVEHVELEAPGGPAAPGTARGRCRGGTG